jgi:3-oxoacyl-[acyl-carrier protein] reductase
MRLQGSRILVTGAANGLGLACATRFIAEGARVLLADIDTANGAAAAATLGENAAFIACDVASRADIDAAISACVARWGGIDVLVNNAGLGGEKLVVEMEDQDWLRVLDVTLNGTFRMTRATLLRMIPRGRGAIVNNASVLGWRAQKGQAHYAAAKAGVMALTRCVGLEAADHGIRVNAVSPSIAMHEHLKKSAPEDFLRELASREAFGRAAEVWEVANVIMFLASDYASYLVGEVLSVSSQHP